MVVKAPFKAFSSAPSISILIKSTSVIFSDSINSSMDTVVTDCSSEEKLLRQILLAGPLSSTANEIPEVSQTGCGITLIRFFSP